MNLLKISTARNVLVQMIDATDNVTGKTGLTLTINSSKNGAALASIAPVVTERTVGFYQIALDTGMTDTLGDFWLYITATGALPQAVFCQVVTDLPGATVSSVTGNVGGNVVGSVASVSGAVGSVTGNVGGNVAGSVASVTAGVTLAAAAVSAIWDKLTSAFVTSGSIGKLIVDSFADITLDIADVQTTVNAIPTTVPDNAGIAAIKAKTDNLPASPANETTVAAIKLKTDLIPAAPASTGDVTTVGTAVAAVNTKLGTPAGASVSADIATKLATTSYTAPDNAGITSIKAKTDNLPASPANESTSTAIKAKTDNLPASPANESTSTAIKAKTDLIPASPASESTSTAIKAKTDLIPAAPASTSDVTTVGTAVAAVSTKLGTPAGASVSADIAQVEGNAVAIKAKTDLIPASPASEATSTAIKAKTDLIPASPASESTSTAIKAKTDLIPASPASETTSLAIKAKTDLIPSGGIASQTSVDEIITTLGTPAGASISADIAVLESFPIKRNAEYADFTFVMTSSDNHIPVEGLSVVATRSLDGGAFADCANAVTEISDGWYKITLAAADMNGATVGLQFSATGADTLNLTIPTNP